MNWLCLHYDMFILGLCDYYYLWKTGKINYIDNLSKVRLTETKFRIHITILQSLKLKAILGSESVAKRKIKFLNSARNYARMD